MRRSLGFIAILLTTGCSPARTPDLNAVDVTLASARAVDCESVCTGILVEVVVKNRGSGPVCFSSRYLVSALGPVILFETGASDTDGFLTNFPRLDESPDHPDHPEPFVRTLKSEPNIFVGGGQELRFEAMALDSYSIPRDRAVTATLSMYVYPCEGEGFRRFSPSAPLQIDDAP